MIRHTRILAKHRSNEENISRSNYYNTSGNKSNFFPNAKHVELSARNNR